MSHEILFICLHFLVALSVTGKMHNIPPLLFYLTKRFYDTVPAQNYTNYDENYGITWMYFPDGDDIPQIIYLTEPPMGSTRGVGPYNSIHFELYTRLVIA